MKVSAVIEAAMTLIEDVKDDLQDAIDNCDTNNDAQARREDACGDLEQIEDPEITDDVGNREMPFVLKAAHGRTRKAQIASAGKMLEAVVLFLNTDDSDLDAIDAGNACSGIVEQLGDIDIPG